MPNNNTTVTFYTLGCRLNQSETAVIENTFKDGYTIVPFDQGADIAIINTCTVTENGDADARRLVNKAVRANAHVKVALIGCQAQVQKDKLLQWPQVHWVIGNGEKMNVADIVRDHHHSQPQVIAPTITKDSFTIPAIGIDNHHTRANIKIQDGCDFFCTFCEIPYARGRARSRVFDDIILESSALAASGHKEIVITGINVGTYTHDDKTIVDVVKTLENIKELERIRISSIEPTTIDWELIEMMRDPKSKLCRYLHIPIQSASDVVLKDMDRKYSYAEFAEFINRVHAFDPNICIGTDVIVGFPSETKEEFTITEERLRELPIDYFHVFSYSKRHLAKSRKFDAEVSPAEIKERSYILRSLSVRKRKMFYQNQINKIHHVIFEQEKNGYWNGLTDNYVRVYTRSATPLTNTTRQVTLKENTGKFVIA